jgi:hypothetical protein
MTLIQRLFILNTKPNIPNIYLKSIDLYLKIKYIKR